MDEYNENTNEYMEVDAPTPTGDEPAASRYRITNNFPVRQQLAVLGGILFLLLGTAVIPRVFSAVTPERPPEASAEMVPIVEEKEPAPAIEKLKLEDVTVNAKAAYVWDVNRQRMLYSKNPDTVLPLASVTKLMTALVAYELIDEDTKVAITLDAIRQEGASGFVAGEQFRFSSLAELTLLSSSNDGAYALASAAGALLADEERQQPSAFVQAMNIKAEEMGLSDTTFLNPTGLDISTTQAGSYSTARETTFLMEYILRHYPEILSATQQSNSVVYNEAGLYHDAENTNVIADTIPNLIGSKTGYTDLAGGNLVVAFDAGFNYPVIVTVLGSTRTGRFADVATLVEAVRDATVTARE